MKKIALLLMIFAFGAVSNSAFAEMFDNLENLTLEQKLKLTNIYQEYKLENDQLENRIMQYTNKINSLKNDPDKTPEQVSLLTGAYERNVQTLKSQQRLLEKTTDELYKLNMSAEQYQQFSAQKLQVQDAFNDFLKK